MTKKYILVFVISAVIIFFASFKLFILPVFNSASSTATKSCMISILAISQRTNFDKRNIAFKNKWKILSDKEVVLFLKELSKNGSIDCSYTHWTSGQLLRDTWGEKYKFALRQTKKMSRVKVIICSSGADKKFRTGDDIVVPDNMMFPNL